LLSDETARYLPRILAVKEILENPKKYGFIFDKSDLYTDETTYEVKVDSVITDMTGFAKGFGMNYKELKRHNPWLREAHLNNKSNKLYKIKVTK
jgi:hypothetical protein